MALAIAVSAGGCASTQEKPAEKPVDAKKDENPAPTPQPLPKEKAPNGQLPATVTPTAYVLDIDTDPRKDSFDGKVTIDVDINAPLTNLWMHGAKAFSVKSAKLRFENSAIVGAWHQTTDEVAQIVFPVEVKPGKGTLEIEYTAPYDKELKGIYKVENGGESYLFTQFEATSFRYSFPSFDEPRFKTPFTSIVTVHKGDKVVSNTPEAKREDLGDGKVRVTFMPTPPLPTYLVAYAVGPLDIVEADPIPANEFRKEPLPFNGVAVKGKGSQLAYALKHTPGILKALEDYFGAPYPFKKLSVIAVPDFASGAMENVGAVTFREWLLLVDEKTAPTSQRRAFHSVMAHELAHMWFGDLVTMPWWDDIWLNEAFATWMSSKAVHAYDKSLGADIDPLRRAQGAMGADSLISARQIRNPVETNDDIRNAFDSITYSKGGGVLGMFESYLGEEKFRDGIRKYMKDHAFGSATYEDLIAALAASSGQDIAPAFKSFLFQPGVPFLEVATSCPKEGENKGKTVVEIAQSRYFPIGSKGDTDKTWIVPFCAEAMVGKKRVKQCALVDKKEQQALTFDGCAKWVHPNPQGAGYYRFSLQRKDLESLLKQFKSFDTLSRIAIADAVTASFDRGTITVEDVFPLLPTLADDKHPAVASKPMGIVSFVETYVVEEDLKPKVQDAARKMYKNQLRRLGTKARKSDDGDTKQLRSSVLSFLVETGRDSALQKKLAANGVKMIKDGKSVPGAVEADLANVSLASAVREKDAAFHASLMELLKTEENPVMRNDLLFATLAAPFDEAKYDAALPLILDERLRTNEVFTAVRASMHQYEKVDKAWAFFTDNGDKILERIPTTAKGWVPWVGSRFCTNEGRDKVKAFFEPRVKDMMGAPRNLKGALEAIELCQARVEVHAENAITYFAGERRVK